MENRIALIGIIVEDLNATEKVNSLLHSYADKIVGRMGIPYRNYGVSIISVIIDATSNELNTLAGKLGRIEGITVKTMQAIANPKN